jgi:hypothetical protein
MTLSAILERKSGAVTLRMPIQPQPRTLFRVRGGVIDCGQLQDAVLLMDRLR